MTAPVLVTGASGKTGRHVVRGLRDEGIAVRTAGRTPSTVPDHVHFDWHDPATYEPALSGVERVYLVAPVGVLDPTDAIETFLDVAERTGVRRVVFLSHDVMPPDAPGLDRARLAVRRMPEWAALRPSWFMQNLTTPHHHMGRGLRQRLELPSATDGRGIGFVDAADIAAVAVRTLLDDRPSGEHVVTGPEVLGYDTIAAILGAVLDRPVRHARLDVGRLAARMGEDGVPREFATVLAGAERLIAAGAEERVTDTVERLTGARPRSFVEFAWAHRDALRPA